jgi:hypothetical protein
VQQHAVQSLQRRGVRGEGFERGGGGERERERRESGREMGHLFRVLRRTRRDAQGCASESCNTGLKLFLEGGGGGGQ